MHDKNISPVGWYIGSYLIRLVELGHPDNQDLDERFTAWENTVIVKAANMDEAYDKVVKVAQRETAPYKGGTDEKDMQWTFEGLTELIPVYEALGDGAEIMFREHHPTMLKNLKKLVRDKSALIQAS